jgi:DNA helicase-2/ATP-dependent DNA helicase PcrA
MSGLNPPQRAAVNHKFGPLLVLAGAGTGKTRVITYRIAKLIGGGCAPDRILGVTFTNKAANEMQERLGKLLPKKSKAKPLITTFHSLCVRILRRNIELLGYPPKFQIYCGGEQESLARKVLREINVSDAVLAPNQLLFQISSWKSRRIHPDDAESLADDDRSTVAAIGYRRYQQQLKTLGAVDFDDLLLLTERLFDQHGDVRESEAERFDFILVDEYQDTNDSQYRIVRALAQAHKNLCVVGDDDQSIYGWRGAEVAHILGFKNDWPTATTIWLEDNYRSTSEILTLANRLIKYNRVRHDKILRPSRDGGEPPQILQFPDETKEAEQTVASIVSRIATYKREPRDFAILFRTNEQPRPFEAALRKAKVPYVLVGGMSFFDRKEVQDTIAYLRLLDGEQDDLPLLRVINRPARGIGKSALDALQQQSRKANVSVTHMLFTPHERPGGLPSAAQKGLDDLAAALLNARRIAENSLVDAVNRLIVDVNYEQEINRLYSEPDDRMARMNTVQQVVNALGQYVQESKQPKLGEFLDQMLLGERDANDDKEKQLNKNAVVLMTLHSAKGLEFPEVYLVGLEEGILPHHRSLEDDEKGVDEERRLAYVGVTRAEERLTLSLSLSRMKWGKPRPSIPSRFLYEMTGKADHPNYLKTTGRSPRKAPSEQESG